MNAFRYKPFMKFLLPLILFAAGCEPLVPWTHERPVIQFRVTTTDSRGVNAWTSYEGPTVLTVHNPLYQDSWVHVKCHPTTPPGYPDEGPQEWAVCVKARGQKMRLVEFMAVDALRQVCAVDRWWPASCPASGDDQ